MNELFVQKYEHIAEVHQLAWDGVVQHSSAPIFYRWEWLHAFESATVERIVAHRYFAIQDRNSFITVLPAYCVQFSPFWHGYEIDANQESVFSGSWVAAPSLYAFSGGIPSRGGYDPDHVAGMILHEALRFAEDTRSQALGFLNVPEGAPLLDNLAKRADQVVFLDVNYVLPLHGDFKSYLHSLPKRVRDDLKRRRRRAAEQGLVCRILKGKEGNVDFTRFHALAIEPTEKYGVPPLYDLPTLEALASLPCASFLISLKENDLLGGFLVFEDEAAIYVWCAAIDYSRIKEFSTYVSLMYEIISYAYESGKQRIEFGRGNYAFKRKHGFQGIPLYSLFFLTSHADPMLSQRLAMLHTNLIHFVEQHGGDVPGTAS